MSHDPDKQYKQDAYSNQKLITRDISKASSSRTWIRQGTSHKESTDRPAPPPNSSLTLHLSISKDYILWRTNLLLIAGSDPHEENMN